MSEVFLKIVNMSISASWLVLVVLVLRLILKKAPKWVNVLLWALVAIRLISPFSIESRLSLIPDVELRMQDIVADFQTSSKGQILDSQGNVLVEKDLIGASQAKGQILDSDGKILLEKPLNQISDFSDTSTENPIRNLSLIWFIGVILMIGYTLISYLLLKRKVSTSIPLRKGIRQSEYINSPFVLGLFHPVVYLPYGMENRDIVHVVAHEQAHIRRKDHWWKPLGFLLLTIHWFNPLMWVAYILLCRDIELACDEKVIKELDNEQRADYTQALVACSINRRSIAACPLAFGEVGVKERVKSVMNYRKPTFWIMVTAVAICIIVAVCFLTDPNPSREFSMSGKNVSSLDPEAIVDRILDIEDIDNSNVYMNSLNFDLQVDSNFNWADSQTVRYFYMKDHKTQSAQLRIFPEEELFLITESSEWIDQDRVFLLRHYLEALKYLPQEEIRQMAPADQYIIRHIDEGKPGDYTRVITYSSEGAGEIDGWFIHLRLEPLHAADEGFHGTGDEVVELFFGDSVSRSGGDNLWNGELVSGTTYVPYQCLYMNPLSSYFAFGGDSGSKYIVGEDSFTTVGRNDSSFVSVTYPGLDTAGDVPNNIIPVTKWEWQDFPYSDEEWAALYAPDGFGEIQHISELYSDMRYQPLTPGKFLLRMDSSLWLVELAANNQMGTYLWSVYSLVPESAMGFTQWEYAPLLSSRLPVFRFEFNMAYSQITATCVDGLLVDWDTQTAPSGSTVTFQEGNSLYWSPTDADGNVVSSAEILFTVYQDDVSVYGGTIYIEGNGGSDGRKIYDASLVGTGLHLDPNRENEGAIVSAMDLMDGVIHTTKFDLTTGNLEIPAEDLDQYTFLTNSAKISVTIKSNEDINGELTLLDVSQNNGEIQLCTVNSKNRSCLFSNLTSEKLYQIKSTGLENCIVTISNGKWFFSLG